MAWALKPYWRPSINKVKRELSEVVQTIARFEPVKVLAPRGVQLREARREFAGCTDIEVIEAPVDDIWMRDIGPTFAIRTAGKWKEVVALDWNFNGWGGRYKVIRGEGRAADIVAAAAGVDCIRAKFRAEGGALVFDGRGTAITTRSCLLNPNRNPFVSDIDRQRWIEDDLRRFGIDRVVWLEGDPSEPITGGHVDGYVLLCPGGKALVEYISDSDVEGPMWRDHDIVLLASTKTIRQHKFRIEKVAAPHVRYWKKKSEFFAPAYLNAYVANGAVIAARFGDSVRDQAAKIALERAFPERVVVQLEINHIAEGGGGIHCLTQPMWTNYVDAG